MKKKTTITMRVIMVGLPVMALLEDGKRENAVGCPFKREEHGFKTGTKASLLQGTGSKSTSLK